MEANLRKWGKLKLGCFNWSWNEEIGTPSEKVQKGYHCWGCAFSWTPSSRGFPPEGCGDGHLEGHSLVWGHPEPPCAYRDTQKERANTQSRVSSFISTFFSPASEFLLPKLLLFIYTHGTQRWLNIRSNLLLRFLEERCKLRACATHCMWTTGRSCLCLFFSFIIRILE